ncbi:MAG: tRNA (adenosine(37)-N6)-threonylcarbamoyltransferase complex dimerization subunit type 1 TsaB [Thermoleophilaceae bacterium]|nr:tRNA (adenosine(37)-N6)-threonylcarbamoyltransferase complex dimerization subunit type 1 TsaB [Thermoleophilaceae bacterium]
MTLIAFDTSTPVMTATVCGAGTVQAEGPAQRELLPALERLLSQRGLGFGDVSAIGVGTGPGSFTSLRIGIATARGLVAAHGAELRPLSSLWALAQNIEAPRGLAVFDARRDEVFAALYEGGRAVFGPWVGAPAELPESCAGAVAAGDGSVRFRELLERIGIEIPPDEDPVHRIQGQALCRLAESADAVAPEAVLPEYLRSPDVT